MTQEEMVEDFLDRVQGLLDNAYKKGHIVIRVEDLENAFPELRERDDERIRKDMITWLKGFIGEASGVGYTEDEIKERIAWLEKQGEQKPVDKVEPKFKIGDWVIDKQGIVHQIANVIENMTNHTYGYDIVGGGYFNDEVEGVRLWTIDDAKDGDVIVCDSKHGRQQIGIVKRYVEKYGMCFVAYCFVDWDGIFRVSEYMGSRDIHPATKEQRDTLFARMKDEGYGWDAEKKELKRI